MCNYCLYKRKDDIAGNGAGNGVGNGSALHRVIPVKRAAESTPPPTPPVAASEEAPTSSGEPRWDQCWFV